MVAKLGKSVRESFSQLKYTIGYFGKLIAASFTFLKRNKASGKILIMQLLFTYVEALPITTILSVGIGTAIVFLGNSLLVSIGQAKLTYTLLVIVITRELGPLLTGFVVTARSATAIATELASNVINHEIEAYISVGIDPISHLAAPRFLGVTLSMFFLNIYFSVFGLLAPALVIQFISTTNMTDYFNSLFMTLTLKDVFISILKSIIFGMSISTIATYFGFKAGRASTEIPLAGLFAVSKSFLVTILADVFITALSYIF